jgi:UDP-N-acetylglucosamine transferase subunit ALG13
MIFVTVGTNEAPFDRLIRGIARLRLDEDFVIQHGHSSAIAVAGAEVVNFLPFERMVQTMQRARAVVTHAGVGSVMVALANGKRPIVVPRRKSFGEAVDDHQLQLGRRFAAAGLVTLVEELDDLAEALTRQQQRANLVSTSNPLATDLRRFLDDVVAGTR